MESLFRRIPGTIIHTTYPIGSINGKTLILANWQLVLMGLKIPSKICRRKHEVQVPNLMQAWDLKYTFSYRVVCKKPKCNGICVTLANHYGLCTNGFSQLQLLDQGVSIITGYSRNWYPPPKEDKSIFFGSILAWILTLKMGILKIVTKIGNSHFLHQKQ